MGNEEQVLDDVMKEYMASLGRFAWLRMVISLLVVKLAIRIAPPGAHATMENMAKTALGTDEEDGDHDHADA